MSNTPFSHDLTGLTRRLHLPSLAALTLSLWITPLPLMAADNSQGWVPGVGGSPGPLVPADDTAAIKAVNFLDSIGVCTHMSQGEDDPAKVGEVLKFIGIRCVRDDGARKPEGWKRFLDVHKASGAKFSPLSVNGDVATTILQAETLAAEGALLAVEGPNEVNNFAVTYNGKKSSMKGEPGQLPVAEFQRDLYAAVKANPKLAGIPVFHASEAGGVQINNCGLQFLVIPQGAGTLMPDGTKYADYENVHNYLMSRKDITADNVAWRNAADNAGMNSNHQSWYGGKKIIGYPLEVIPTLPKVTTETGWNTDPQSIGGIMPDGTAVKKGSITEAQQGKLFLNLYLAQYKRGYSHTFVYMLKDSRGQGSWGMVRGDYSYKPSATNLHNLTTILADKATDFKPGKVSYSIPNKPEAVHDLLLQKSDGTFELVVWGEHGKGSSEITVNLGANYPSVKVYDPTVGTEPVKTLAKANSVPLTMSDHPFIIEIDPAAH